MKARKLSMFVTSLAVAGLALITCSAPAFAQQKAKALSGEDAADARIVRSPIPVTPASKLEVSATTLAKLHMVVTFLETKPAFTPGISSERFVNIVFSPMRPAPIPPWLRTYVLRAYEYHVKGVSPDVVYATEDGRAFADLSNAIMRTYKRGMTREQFESQLIPGTSPEYGDPVANKPKWINTLRKIVDVVAAILHAIDH